MALVPLVASTATAVATLLLEQDLIAAALMPCIVFGVIYGGTHGARWSALGVIGLMSYTIGLVTRLPLGTLPARILTICLGVSGAGLVRFILLPDNPQSELDRLRREIERCLGQLLVSVEAALTT